MNFLFPAKVQFINALAKVIAYGFGQGAVLPALALP